MNFHQSPRISRNFKGKTAGFTLIELLIYSGILVVAAGLISGIFYTISKSFLKTQAENEVDNQMARFEEIFRQKIETAKGTNSFGVGGASLELNMGAFTVTFSLSDYTAYIQEADGPAVLLNDASKVKVTSLTFTPTGASGAQISNAYHYAWNDNVGWLDWAYPGGNVKVPVGAGDLSGAVYILSDLSWISLNCLTSDSCGSSNYKVSSDANGNLSGWAWSDNYGWISFSCKTGGASGEDICSSSDYGVKVATTTTASYQAGEFDGYAYSENIGWVSVNCKTGGQSQANICSTSSNYRVQDLRLNTSAVKVDITLQYNSTRPEQQITKSNSFVFNIVTPAK